MSLVINYYYKSILQIMLQGTCTILLHETCNIVILVSCKIVIREGLVSCTMLIILSILI